MSGGHGASPMWLLFLVVVLCMYSTSHLLYDIYPILMVLSQPRSLPCLFFPVRWLLFFQLQHTAKMAAMDQLVQTINQIILRPELHDILAILKGARNGFVYGVSELPANMAQEGYNDVTSK
jgi:hypothetical protein